MTTIDISITIPLIHLLKLISIELYFYRERLVSIYQTISSTDCYLPIVAGIHLSHLDTDCFIDAFLKKKIHELTNSLFFIWFHL